jgi:hypothetical protein
MKYMEEYFPSYFFFTSCVPNRQFHILTFNVYIVDIVFKYGRFIYLFIYKMNSYLNLTWLIDYITCGK